jgi:hypothetical protein
MVYAEGHFANACSKRGGNLLELNAPARTMRDDVDHREA